ncbi:calmodulin-like protein 4 [Branchiostoma floridae]|uniref:Calmodulin-like protein 4 n=1 Tax=Branchiostoma floridae TaxID=7739 RepID=A0A9J7M513_BRAFL|nr:calmodulin-like protein 4 [Branchiostoma floridae]
MIHYDKAPKNGVLELNEFKNLVADMKAIQNSKREEVLDAFFKFDKDKSGFIEPNELKEVLTYLGLASGEEIVKTMIGVADSNKDGKISITELANVMGHTAVGAEDIQQWTE